MPGKPSDALPWWPRIRCNQRPPLQSLQSADINDAAPGDCHTTHLINSLFYDNAYVCCHLRITVSTGIGGESLITYDALRDGMLDECTLYMYRMHFLGRCSPGQAWLVDLCVERRRTVIINVIRYTQFVAANSTIAMKRIPRSSAGAAKTHHCFDFSVDLLLLLWCSLSSKMTLLIGGDYESGWKKAIIDWQCLPQMSHNVM